MDTLILKKKFDILREHVARVEEYADESYEAFESNMLSDVAAFALCKAVRVSTAIALHVISRSDRRTPDTIADSFSTLADIGAISEATADVLKQMTHIRNVAMHLYVPMDTEILHKACTVDLGVFKSFAREVCDFLGLLEPAS